MAASKEAARLGLKVAVCDFVKPTPKVKYVLICIVGKGRCKKIIIIRKINLFCQVAAPIL